MLKKYIKNHLEGLIAAYFTIIVIVLTIVFGSIATGYIYYQTSKTVLRNVELLLQEKVDVVKNRIVQIQTVRDILISEDSDFVKILCSDETDHVRQIHNYRDAKNILKNYMSICLNGQSYRSSAENYVAVLYGNSSLEISRVYPQKSADAIRTVEIRSEQEVIQQKWYEDAIENDGNIIWIGIDERNRLCGAVNIRSYETETSIAKIQQAGVLYFAFWCDELFEGLSSNMLTKDTTIMFYSEDQAIYTNNLENNKKSYSYTFSLVDDLEICYEIPQNNIYQFIGNYILIMLITIVIFLLAGIFVVVKLSHIVTVPIAQLSNHMSYGEIKEIAEPKNENEIKQIYKSYNQMVQRINALIEQIKQTEMEKRNTEINLLQAQINPHFIFNTLDTVGCGLLENGEDELAQCLSDLADYIRYNIRNYNGDIALKNEFKMIQNYLRIKQIQGLYKIEYIEDLDESCKNALVPKMLVQPLIENAIEHGIVYNQQSNIVHIEVKTEQKGSSLYIIVRNTSTIADVSQINRHLKGEINISRKGSGLGIKNVNDRIKMRYGSQYGLFYDMYNGMVEARIIIPFFEA